MKSKTPIVDASARHIYGPEEFIEARIARQLETELAEKNELLMKTNHVHIENQRLQKALNGELETNQRLTDELTEARAEIERLKNQLEDESMRADGMTTAHAEAGADSYRMRELIEQMREALELTHADFKDVCKSCMFNNSYPDGHFCSKCPTKLAVARLGAALAAERGE